jgi:quercetin dioxygenase-like cupin family protein
MTYQYYPDWKDAVAYMPQGPKQNPLYLDEQFKVLTAGLEPGHSIPEHPEGRSVYFFLEGTGTMKVDGEAVEVRPGSILVMPDGAVRGLQAHTRLAFLAARVAMQK